MNQRLIETIVEEVVSQLNGIKAKPYSIPIAVSARHCHLSIGDLEELFGEGFKLTKKRICHSLDNSQQMNSLRLWDQEAALKKCAFLVLRVI